MIKELNRQRPSSGLKNMKLLHDNASSHYHKDVFDYLKEEGLNLLPHLTLLTYPLVIIGLMITSSKT